VRRNDSARYQPRLHDLRHYAESRTMPSESWMNCQNATL
jgi:hypothetical protein